MCLTQFQLQVCAQFIYIRFIKTTNCERVKARFIYQHLKFKIEDKNVPNIFFSDLPYCSLSEEIVERKKNTGQKATKFTFKVTNEDQFTTGLTGTVSKAHEWLNKVC